MTARGSLKHRYTAAYDVCRDAGVRFICKLPKITTDTLLDTVRSVMPGLAAGGMNEYMVEQCGAAYALARTGQKPALSGSTGLNVFNHRTVLALSSMIGHLTLSQELSGDEIRILIQAARSQGLVTRFALIVQGSGELMISEDCLLQPWLRCTGEEPESAPASFTGIMDITGRIFPVRIDGECRTHVYNSAELCLIDHLPSLMKSGIGELVIDARGRTGDYTRDMVLIYRKALQMAKNGIRHGDHRFKLLKDEIKCRSSGSITAGHFTRGLKES